MDLLRTCAKGKQLSHGGPCCWRGCRTCTVVHSSTIQIEIGTTDSYIFTLLSDIFLISFFFPFLPSSPRINRRDMSLNYFKYAVEISVRVVGVRSK